MDLVGLAVVSAEALKTHQIGLRGHFPEHDFDRLLLVLAQHQHFHLGPRLDPAHRGAQFLRVVHGRVINFQDPVEGLQSGFLRRPLLHDFRNPHARWRFLILIELAGFIHVQLDTEP